MEIRRGIKNNENKVRTDTVEEDIPCGFCVLDASFMYPHVFSIVPTNQLYHHFRFLYMWKIYGTGRFILISWIYMNLSETQFLS